MEVDLLLGVGTDNGALVLRPGSPHSPWELIVHGLYNHCITCITQHPDGSIYAGAAQGTVYKTQDWENWEPLFEGLDYTSIYSLLIDTRQPNRIYAGTSPAALFRSDNKGRVWVKNPTFHKVPGADKWSYDKPPYLPRLGRILQHPIQRETLVAAIQSGGILWSDDEGVTWEERYATLPRQVYDICLHPKAPDRVYAATMIGYFRSDDRGHTWSNLIAGLPYLFCRCLAVDSENPDLVVMGVDRNQNSGGSIFRSEDGGRTWSACSTGLDDLDQGTVTCMASGQGYLFAGTSTGQLFASSDGGKFWPRIRPPLPPIRSLAVLKPVSSQGTS